MIPSHDTDNHQTRAVDISSASNNNFNYSTANNHANACGSNSVLFAQIERCIEIK